MSTSTTSINYGVNLLTQYRGGAGYTLELRINPDTVYDGGFHYLRIQTYWPFSKYLTPLLSHYTSVNSKFQPIIVIDNQLQQPPSSQEFGSSWTLANWDTFVQQTIQAVPNGHIWEIFSEVTWHIDACIKKATSSCIYSGYFDNYGATIPGMTHAYFDMVRDASNFIRNQTGHSSDTVICFGGTTGYTPYFLQALNHGKFTSTDEYQIIQQAWSYGLAKYCNAISVHIYPIGGWFLDQYPSYCFPSGCVTSTQTGAGVLSTILNLEESLTKVPIWITETGYPVGGSPISNVNSFGPNGSLTSQATWAQQIYQFLNTFPYIKFVAWWDEVNEPAVNYDWGLFDPTTLQTRPAFTILTHIQS
jgi:hypothetical protein